MSSGVVGSPPAPLWCWELIRRALGPPPSPANVLVADAGYKGKALSYPTTALGVSPLGRAVLVTVGSGESLGPSVSIEAKTFGSSTPAFTSCELRRWSLGRSTPGESAEPPCGVRRARQGTASPALAAGPPGRLRLKAAVWVQGSLLS